ncbi:aspartyl protease family protein At5g10770-like [Macadamia integrifolia]|uniref:aspartyl protease family protein At5g10770-like n=1 Tax=Macadamia integrifolia TaxID=60698 RepID=UPI001C5008A0|nr:aspartyl protease family protein At5g10770-like [Macadamia integrifolia]
MAAKNLSQLLTYHVVSLSSLMPASVCSTPAQGSKSLSGLLEVTHKYGPCSPLKQGNAKIPSLRQILIDDQTRVNSIHSKFSNQQSPVAGSKLKLPANSGISLGTGEFIVRIGFGTPKKDFTVVFDTGSDLTWIQCLPCTIQCFLQQDPYFNPSASSTYSNIQCGSAACSQVKSATGYSPSCTTDCIYQAAYNDGSTTEGYFSTDTLTLSSSAIFPNFKFGCGENNQAPLLLGSADGLLGLGRDPISIVSQTAQKYGKLFSYCLPSTTSSTGFLTFGSQAGASSSSLQYTPLLINSDRPDYYYITMTGISVEGQLLSIPESVFRTSGTIIDSGTVISRLAPTAYSALRLAFRLAMSKYPATASPYSLYDTCYDFSGYTSVQLPSIVLHLGGGTDLNVDESGILYHATSSVYCLAFSANDADTDLGILGNNQQKRFEVVYNVAGGKLGFGAGACS